MFKIKNPASLKTSTRPLGKIKPMSTRNIVKKHLKEWNKDEEDVNKEIEEEIVKIMIKERKSKADKFADNYGY